MKIGISGLRDSAENIFRNSREYLMKKLIAIFLCASVQLYGMDNINLDILSGLDTKANAETENMSLEKLMVKACLQKGIVERVEKIKQTCITLPAESELCIHFKVLAEGLVQPNTFSLKAIQALAGKQLSVQEVINGAVGIVREYQRDNNNRYAVSALSHATPAIVKILLSGDPEISKEVMFISKAIIPIDFDTASLS
jgi:hypothetical protein